MESLKPILDCKICEKEGITCRIARLLRIKIGRNISTPQTNNLISVVTIEECRVRNGEETPGNFAKGINQINFL